MPGDPFDLDGASAGLLPGTAMAAARPLLSWLLRLPAYRALYQRTRRLQALPFEQRALAVLDIRAAVVDDERDRVPASGPLVVASNHPHGVLDGLLLAAVIGRRRSDVRILTNRLLSRIPELSDLCFYVDPFDGPAAAARSGAGLRAAHLWLRRGGALVVFPSGEVAHLPGPGGSRLESAWRPTVARLVLGSGARVVPAFIDGTNSRLFYAAGRVHPMLRTALLARELLASRGRTVPVRFGVPLTAEGLATSAAGATASIRRAVEALRPPHVAAARSRPARLRVPGAGGPAPLGAEIASLPDGACLVERGDCQVFVAEAQQIPAVLHELGRLREASFRAVGEGTGRPVDIDGFDARYLHLFSWDRARRHIVGGYRIGRTDAIVATAGVAGLYTRTLFRYDERLLARLPPALELGRSFVRAEHQKNHGALLLLWQGIGQFVARHPHYRVLFGPVSISARYALRSQRLMLTFLQHYHLDRELAGLVEPVDPRRVSLTASGERPRSATEADRLVAQAEADGKGLPVLLRQYLKLNATVLGFNVDPLFGHALDALMLVDLTRVPRALLHRYLGAREAGEFLWRHRTGQSSHAA